MMARQGQLSIDDDWWEERPVSRHRADFGGIVAQTWAFFFFAALCAGLACIGFFVPAKEGPVVGAVMGVIGAAGALGFIGFGIYRYAMLIKDVDLHDGGVVWNGGRQMAGWDDIKHFLRYELLINGSVSRREITIKTHDGTEAVFTHAVGNWKKLADRIQEEVYLRQIPQAMADFQAGEKVRFGPHVAISLVGLTVGGKSVPWERVDSVRVRNGYITAVTGGPYREEHPIPIGETPNFPVLLKLLEISPAGLGVE